MLDAGLKTQLKAYLENITQPIKLIASLDEGAKSTELRELLTEIASLSPSSVTFEENGNSARKPSFLIQRVDSEEVVEFAGIPLGHEFTSLVLALLQVGGHPIKMDEATANQIRGLDQDLVFETYYSLSCQNCPDVVQALNAMAVLNPRIKHTSIDGALFQEEVKEREVMSVPAVFLNGEEFHYGRANAEELLAKLGAGDSEEQIAALNDKAPFDVLVVGGGPAGAAAAIYAARKGIRT